MGVVLGRVALAVVLLLPSFEIELGFLEGSRGQLGMLIFREERHDTIGGHP